MSDMINFYDKIPKDMRKTYHNPGFKKHRTVIPSRWLVIAASGGGKSTFALQYIHDSSGTYEHIAVCLKSRHEPLYEFLEKKIPPESLTFYENTVPQISELENYKQSLIIFDDLIVNKNLQTQIADFYIRSRKFGITCMYLSQSYFSIPKIIRGQANYIVIKKLASDKDLALILREYSFNISQERLIQIYKKVTAKKTDFLLIDLEADNNQKFRINWKVMNLQRELPFEHIE